MRWGARFSTALGPGAVAGLAGAVLIDIYLIVVLVVFLHAVTVTQFYQYVASGILGKAAYGAPGFAYLGALVHVAVGVLWGAGYAYVAATTPQVRARPLVSGIAFGIVVMLAMQLVEVAANIYTLPTTFTLANAIVAHVIFFGVPVAYIVAARLRSER